MAHTKQRSTSTRIRFQCQLKISGLGAETEDVNALVFAMSESLELSGAAKIEIDGSLQDDCFLTVSFVVSTPDDLHEPSVFVADPGLWGLAITIGALRAGQVSAPGWPDGTAIDNAIAQAQIWSFNTTEAEERPLAGA